MAAALENVNPSLLTIKTLALAAGDADPVVRAEAQRGLGELLGPLRQPPRAKRPVRLCDGAGQARATAGI